MKVLFGLPVVQKTKNLEDYLCNVKTDIQASP